MGLYEQKETVKYGIMDNVGEMLYVCSCRQNEKTCARVYDHLMDSKGVTG